MLTIVANKAIEAWKEFQNDYNALSSSDTEKAKACMIPMNIGLLVISWKIDPWITSAAIAYSVYKAYKLNKKKEKVAKERAAEALVNYKSYMEGKA